LEAAEIAPSVKPAMEIKGPIALSALDLGHEKVEVRRTDRVTGESGLYKVGRTLHHDCPVDLTSAVSSSGIRLIASSSSSLRKRQ